MNEQERRDPFAVGVEVKGEVQNPGFYELEGLGAIEAIHRAGGVTDNADYQNITIANGDKGRVLDLLESVTKDNPDIYVPPDWVVTVPRVYGSSNDNGSVNNKIKDYISKRKEQADPQYHAELLEMSLSENKAQWAARVLKGIRRLVGRDA